MMIRAASLPIEVNLLRFSRFLQSQGIAHRINEESGQQVIWVESDQQATLVRETLATWPFDEDSSLGSPVAYNLTSLFRPIAFLRKLIQASMRAPVSFSLILACLLVAVLSLLGAESQRVAILFYPVLDSSGLLPLLASIDSPAAILRSLSPMLLHFGELHLVFNMMWLWYFGRQLESVQPRWLFIMLILFCSFAGNTAQYLTSGYNNFGGMSGVVYGLVGYTWIVHTFMPRSNLLINNKMFVVFVISLVAMEVFASSWVANAAHLGGLIAGLVVGVGVVGHYRFVLGREAIGS
ncbi:MAG: rhomboid family intramembrane serine protease [Proteobacteria bacterium]|nr:rhomboid family intramembrane serine protease [Pseudomonadota bacterium]